MGTRALPIVAQSDTTNSSRQSASAQSAAQQSSGKQEPMGFFTDTTICIGCKACEVACKEWNQLPAGDGGAHVHMSGQSYDNTLRLSGDTWRHVKFVEQFPETATRGAGS